MVDLAVIRHAPTAWNEERRIQGHTDVPLSTAGRDLFAGKRLPPELAAARWVSSPLKRCRETARLLGAPRDMSIEPRLIEMNWGAWEGHTVKSLRAEFGAQVAGAERRGLDFRPPGGESPRDVQARARSWLAEVAADGQPVVAVTHKGVARALLAMATGWDLLSPPPARLDWTCAHLFVVRNDGTPQVARLNIALEPMETPA